MLEYGIIIAVIAQAVNAVFSEGMIFGKEGAQLEGKYHWLWKPLMGCPTCMSFWYGLPLVFVFDCSLFSIPIAMGINWVIGKFHE